MRFAADYRRGSHRFFCINAETRGEVYGQLLAFLERHLPPDSVGEQSLSATKASPE